MTKIIKVETFIRELHKLTYGKTHKEMTINVAIYLSKFLMIEPPNIKFQNDPAYYYDCRTKSLELPNEKYLEESLQEYISDIAHELMHHAMCLGRKVDKNIDVMFEHGNEIIWFGEAEEAAAEKFADIIFNMIEMINLNEE